MTAAPANPALARLRALHGEAIRSWSESLGDAAVEIEPSALMDVMTSLRDDPELAFVFLIDLTAVDHLGRSDRDADAPRFEVVYHLRSLEPAGRIRVKAGVAAELTRIESVCGIWPAANWLEREVWDLYGIEFRHHPDLRRILLYEAFEGHPLRKDYPKTRRQPLVAGTEEGER